jgi:large subunit ribosomal protein L29
MKAEDLKGKTVDELHKMLLDTRKAQMNMRFQRSSGQLEKTHDIRTTRRDIARIKTFLSAQRIKDTGGKHAVKAAAKAKNIAGAPQKTKTAKVKKAVAKKTAA